jgi:hypothetical protein
MQAGIIIASLNMFTLTLIKIKHGMYSRVRNITFCFASRVCYVCSNIRGSICNRDRADGVCS